MIWVIVPAGVILKTLLLWRPVTYTASVFVDGEAERNAERMSRAVAGRVHDLGNRPAGRDLEDVVAAGPGHVDVARAVDGDVLRVVEGVAGAVARFGDDLGDVSGGRRGRGWTAGRGDRRRGRRLLEIDDLEQRRVLADDAVDTGGKCQREGAAGNRVRVRDLDLVVDLGRTSRRVEVDLEVVVERHVGALNGDDQCRRYRHAAFVAGAREGVGRPVTELDFADAAEDDAGRSAEMRDPPPDAVRGRPAAVHARPKTRARGTVDLRQEFEDASEDGSRGAHGARSRGSERERARRGQVGHERPEVPAVGEGVHSGDRLARELRGGAAGAGLQAGRKARRVGRCRGAGGRQRGQVEPRRIGERREVDRGRVAFLRDRGRELAERCRYLPSSSCRIRCRRLGDTSGSSPFV